MNDQSVFNVSVAKEFYEKHEKRRKLRWFRVMFRSIHKSHFSQFRYIDFRRLYRTDENIKQFIDDYMKLLKNIERQKTLASAFGGAALILKEREKDVYTRFNKKVSNSEREFVQVKNSN